MTDQTEAAVDAALANLTYYRPLSPPDGTRWVLYECAYDAADADEDDDDAPKCGYQYVAPVEDKSYGLDVPAGPIEHCPACGGYLSFVGQEKIGVTSGPWKREGKPWEPPVASANSDLLARVAATLEHSAAVEAERDELAESLRRMLDRARAAEARVEAAEQALRSIASFDIDADRETGTQGESYAAMQNIALAILAAPPVPETRQP